MKNNNTTEAQHVDMKELGYALNTIKQDIINTRNKILHESNKELIYLYFRIGKQSVKIKNMVHSSFKNYHLL